MTIHHDPHVAGRYRDGFTSDHWTDVLRCADRTFIAYLAGCTCGWAGPDRAADDIGYRRCLRDGERHRAERSGDATMLLFRAPPAGLANRSGPLLNYRSG